MDKKNNKIRELLKAAPQPKAHIANKSKVPLTREITWVLASGLMIIGFICIIFTNQFHQAFPYLLGGTMLCIGIMVLLTGVYIQKLASVIFL